MDEDKKGFAEFFELYDKVMDWKTDLVLQIAASEVSVWARKGVSISAGRLPTIVVVNFNDTDEYEEHVYGEPFEQLARAIGEKYEQIASYI